MQPQGVMRHGLCTAGEVVMMPQRGPGCSQSYAHKDAAAD